MTVAAIIQDLWWASARASDDRSGEGASGRRRAVATHAEAPSDDEPIVARLRAGDAVAFDEVVRANFPLLSRVATRLTGSIADGEEVAQEVLFRIWMRRETLRVSSTLTVYLLSAVRNRALNVVRDREVAERHQLHFGETADHELTTSPETNMLDLERRRRVARALAALAPRHRLAVELRYGARASFLEVGATLGISGAAAEQLVRRAVVALRRLLGEEL